MSVLDSGAIRGAEQYINSSGNLVYCGNYILQIISHALVLKVSPGGHIVTQNLNQAKERKLQQSSQLLPTTPWIVVGQVGILSSTPFPSLSLRNVTRENYIHQPPERWLCVNAP